MRLFRGAQECPAHGGLANLLDRRFSELMAVCVNQKLETVRDPEFFEYRAEMVANRGLADEQSFGNLLILEPFADNSQ